MKENKININDIPIEELRKHKFFKRVELDTIDKISKKYKKRKALYHSFSPAFVAFSASVLTDMAKELNISVNSLRVLFHGYYITEVGGREFFTTAQVRKIYKICSVTIRGYCVALNKADLVILSGHKIFITSKAIELVKKFSFSFTKKQAHFLNFLNG